MSFSSFTISLALIFLTVYVLYQTIVLAKGDRAPTLSYCVAVSFIAVMVGLIGFAFIYKGIVQ